MKINFKKVATVLGTALMVGATAGFAAAANYPTPFVQNGQSTTALVIGSSGVAAASDSAAATSIGANLATGITTTGTGNLTIPAGSWQVKTGYDNLELGETINGVKTSISDVELPILGGGSVSTLNSAVYTEKLYFDDITSSKVTYQQDSENKIGLFYKINSGQVIAKYEATFSPQLKSDIATTTLILDDLQDDTISLLGKEYVITSALNTTNGAKLTLMTGAEKTIISGTSPVNIGGYTVSIDVISASRVDVTINGETYTNLNTNSVEAIRGTTGQYFAVTDIKYVSGYAGAAEESKSTLYIGANKLVIENGQSVEVNGVTVADAIAYISSTESAGDMSISKITINMTAEDNLYIPEGGKLSEASTLYYPEVLFGQNWDIVFDGLNNHTDETITFAPSGDDYYRLTFTNIDGHKMTLPVVYTTSSGNLYGGQETSDHSKALVFNASTTIADENWFVLNSGNPASATNNVRSYVVQYAGGTKSTSTANAKVRFRYYDTSGALLTTSDIDVISNTITLSIGSDTFTLANASAVNANDFNISSSTHQGYSAYATNGKTILMRTKNNALVNITDTNASLADSNWLATVKLDDGNRDGDFVDLANSAETLVSITLANSTNEITTTVTNNNLITDPDIDTSTKTYRTNYGAFIKSVEPTGSPASVTMNVPSAVVTPLVYITSGETTTSVASTNIVPVYDSDKTAYQNKNLIVVGGSCVNKVAAELLGLTFPACGDTWKAKTGVGNGQFLIEVFNSPYSTGKVAMLVAGYEAADTTKAQQYLTNYGSTKVNTTAGTKLLGTSATTEATDVTAKA